MEISVKTQKWKFGDLCHVAGDLWEIHGNVSEMSRVLARKIFEKKRKKNQTAKKKMNSKECIGKKFEFQRMHRKKNLNS